MARHPELETIMRDWVAEQPDNRAEPLSAERMAAARETLHTLAFFAPWQRVAAIGQDDPGSIFIEAKRNLTAIYGFLYGPEAQEALDAEPGQ